MTTAAAAVTDIHIQCKKNWIQNMRKEKGKMCELQFEAIDFDGMAMSTQYIHIAESWIKFYDLWFTHLHYCIDSLMFFLTPVHFQLPTLHMTCSRFVNAVTHIIPFPFNTHLKMDIRNIDLDVKQHSNINILKFHELHTHTQGHAHILKFLMLPLLLFWW